MQQEGLLRGAEESLPCVPASLRTSSFPGLGASCLEPLGQQGAAFRVPVRAQENRYVGFGNTVPPPKREEDFLSSAVSSLCSVRTVPCPAPCAPQPHHPRTPPLPQ